MRTEDRGRRTVAALGALWLLAVCAFAASPPGTNDYGIVRGTLINPRGVPWAEVIRFEPLDTPKTNSGAVIVGAPVTVALTNGGFWVSLLAGSYGAVLGSTTNTLTVTAGATNELAAAAGMENGQATNGVVRGTLYTQRGAAWTGLVQFEPLDTPKTNAAGQVIVGAPVTVVATNGGFWTSLRAGSYGVVVGSGRTNTLTVTEGVTNELVTMVYIPGAATPDSWVTPGQLQSATNGLWGAVGTAKTDATNGLWTAVGTAKTDATNGLWSAANSVSNTLWTATRDATNGLWTAVGTAKQDATNGLWTAVGTAKTDATNGLWTAANSVSNTLWGAKTDATNGLWTAVGTAKTDATNGLWSAANSVSNTLWGAKTDATNGLWTAANSTSNVLATAQIASTNDLSMVLRQVIVNATNGTVASAVSTTIGDRTIIAGYNLTPGFNSTTRYYALMGGPVGGQTTEGIVGTPFLKGTITNLYVRGWAVVAGTNVAFTLMTNGVATHITANFNGAGAGAQATANDTTHGLVLPANGTTMSMRIVGNNASASAASVSVGWAFELIR
ncbi:exported hypothetical protein [Gammaproteobacteria bacterium]